MENAAIIVVAGRGSQMIQDLPKQYLPLGTNVAQWHAVKAFLTCDQVNRVSVVIHLESPHRVVRLNFALLGYRA
ncbi:hypothetical protein GV827_23130 [Sulfitobacter sp. JBTF-M27]|uniref:MobA-like NTP transferase domain-containing protein n=1 Tax=Sulfitobacter sediminilitoris TaxID=2698830 RepID=A0A6P0CGJ5_9RHOB|nr:2-C-methyl-D-erythritol 4-phosphate cytidylyltransferase [Sulfitobacter sediminilitoris]NEK25259.1 hypothetical protein [Sulfitobacter sediminilitoris]